MSLGDWLFSLFDGLGEPGVLLCIFVLFFIDAVIFPTLPEVFFLLGLDQNPTVSFGCELLFVAILGELAGIFLLYYIVKKIRVPARVSRIAEKYINFLVVSDERIILVNRIAPMIPFLGAFIALIKTWDPRKCTFYIVLGCIRHRPDGYARRHRRRHSHKLHRIIRQEEESGAGIMKFVDVNPFFYPHHGGIETRMHDTARLLAARGHDVTVLTGRLPDTAEEEMTEFGYRVVRLKSRFINIYNPPFISSEGVLEALRSMDADAVNYNYRWAPSYNKDLGRYDGYKVFTYHNMWGEGTGLTGKVSEINDNGFRKTLETFDHIVCVSDYVRNDLIRRGLPAERMTTIPTCLDLPPEKETSEGDYILSLGRLVKTKGLDSLIEAMKSVDCRLIMCGKGPESQHISRLIARYGLEDRIELRGWVSDEERERLMSECRFFVMPSIQEAYGLAATEVLAHGKPMICTDVDGLPGNVKDAGLYVRPKDSAGLAEAINRLLSDDCLRKELAGNAVKVTRAFTWEGQVAKTEEVYRSVLNG